MCVYIYTHTRTHTYTHVVLRAKFFCFKQNWITWTYFSKNIEYEISRTSA